MILAKAISTCFGIGYIKKGAGTVAALFYCAFWYVFKIYQTTGLEQIIHIAGLFLIGAWSAGQMEKQWGHDSNKVVIDEWMGMGIALFLVPFSWVNLALSFILFRFFDILKPLFIRKVEALPGGWGVMCDDLVAGIYSALILHVLLKTILL